MKQVLTRAQLIECIYNNFLQRMVDGDTAKMYAEAIGNTIPNAVFKSASALEHEIELLCDVMNMTYIDV